MSPERNLCRGWTASAIRQAVREATANQRDALAQIAANPGITSAEIAENLHLKSHRSVASTLGAWTRMVTRPMGVTDPRTGEISWPITFGDPTPGRPGYWRYFMPEEVAEIVLAVAGRT